MQKIVLVLLGGLMLCPGISFAQGVGDAPADALPTIKFEYKDGTVWRPAGFWRLKESANDDVCHKLDAAFQKPWGISTQHLNHGTTNDINRLLGTEYSVKWTRVEHYRSGSTPAHRVQVDLNNDGTQEIIYRLASSVYSTLVYNLYWATSFPDGELKLDGSRFKEIDGQNLDEPKWKGFNSGLIYVSAQSLNALGLRSPSNMRGLSIYEIASINGKHYLLATQASYSGKPLDIVVYQTLDKRHHEAICHFVSTAQLD